MKNSDFINKKVFYEKFSRRGGMADYFPVGLDDQFGANHSTTIFARRKLLNITMKKGFLPAFILFDVVTVAVLIFRNQLYAAGIDAWVILGGNALFFVAAILSMYMNAKAMAHGNTHGFIRNVYGGFLLKFFIIIVAAIAYIVSVKEVNKPALLICMGLYLVYTFLGTRNVLNNKKPVTDGNGKSTV